jgi:hypothetical protein
VKGSDDLERLRLALTGVAVRISLYRGARIACRRVLACAVPALALLAAARLVPLPWAPPAAGMLVLCGALWGAFEAVLGRATRIEAAWLTDRSLGLLGMLPTALEAGQEGAMARALARRAAGSVEALRPSRVAVFPLPWEPAAILLLAGGAFALSALTSPRESAPAAGTAAAAGAEAREVRWLARQIEQRFPESAGLSEELRRFADGLAAPGDSYVRTGRAMAESAARWEGQADRIERAEEALKSLLGDAAPAGPAAVPYPPDAAAAGKARRELEDLMAAPGLSPSGRDGVRGALLALEGGDRPRYIENADVLRAEFRRLRGAMAALEAASLRAKAVSEKALRSAGPAPRVERSAPEDPGRGPGTAGEGGESAAAIPRARAEQALARPRWDPSYDDVVRRYFDSFGVSAKGK